MLFSFLYLQSSDEASAISSESSSELSSDSDERRYIDSASIAADEIYCDTNFANKENDSDSSHKISFFTPQTF